ncbi:GNAT family N-acetyltransferase [Sporosarcina sp. FSL K6-3457]|uniref:GNAT family N-acetyltransferase n=1 Tax=Sporosarcina sp. FSL K6-3457 TaxID=2978204 RepID=UPI004046F3F0
MDNGKGIVIRCVNELTKYDFDCLDLNRIEISCAENNVRSRALPGKLGFVKEGILRDHYYLNRDVHNLVVYSLLKSDRENKSTLQSLTRGNTMRSFYKYLLIFIGIFAISVMFDFARDNMFNWLDNIIQSIIFIVVFISLTWLMSNRKNPDRKD